MRLREVVAGSFLEDGGRKGAKRFAAFDLEVEDVAHLFAARVAEDAAIAERARPPFHPSLEPAHHSAAGNLRRRQTIQVIFVFNFADPATTSRQLHRAFMNRCANLTFTELRAP